MSDTEPKPVHVIVGSPSVVVYYIERYSEFWEDGSNDVLFTMYGQLTEREANIALDAFIKGRGLGRVEGKTEVRSGILKALGLGA